MSELHVSDNPDASRYEVTVDGHLAGFAAYRHRGNQVVFTHTEVEAAFEGQGVGSALARGALDDTRRKGSDVVAQCPFIAAWIDRHPAYQDLLAS